MPPSGSHALPSRQVNRSRQSSAVREDAASQGVPYEGMCIAVQCKRQVDLGTTSTNGIFGPLLKRTKELKRLLDNELRSFFGNEMAASLDLTALDVVGNVLPGGRDVAQKRLSAPS
jgi:hypothetical protein